MHHAVIRSCRLLLVTASTFLLLYIAGVNTTSVTQEHRSDIHEAVIPSTLRQCRLQATMNRDLCEFPTIKKHGIKFRRRVMDLDEADSDMMNWVPHGTVCKVAIVTSRKATVAKCHNGRWELPGKFNRRGKRGWLADATNFLSHTVLSPVVDVVVDLVDPLVDATVYGVEMAACVMEEVLCENVFPSDSGHPDSSHKNPKFQDCPNTQSEFVAEEGETLVNVTWKIPTATDYQGHQLGVFQTTNVTQGFLTEGVYPISYVAKDSEGYSTTCAFTVSAKVIRCSSDHTKNGTADNDVIVGCSPAPSSKGEMPVWGTDCSYYCQLGHTLQGSSSASCQRNGDWDAPKPTCQALSCGDPSKTLDTTGQMQFNCTSSHYSIGDHCYISCTNGNPPQGPPAVSCLLNSGRTTGPDVIWSWTGNENPSCNGSTCPKLQPPANGALACTHAGDVEICTLNCKNGFTPTSVALDVYKCIGNQWDDAYVSNCSQNRNPRNTVLRAYFYYYSNSCSADSLEIKENFLKAINASSMSVVCASGCNVTTVDVTCGSVQSGKRDMGNDATYTVMVTTTISLGPYIDQGSRSNTYRFYDDLSMKIYDELLKDSDADLFKIPEIGTYDGFGTDMVEFECEPGTIFDPSSLSCAVCGEGHIYDVNTDSCMACPVGTYQDQEVALSCIQCPDNKVTMGTRSTSMNQCQHFCAPGTTSNTGYEKCDVCPRGSYQSQAGMTSCDLCPYGMSTLQSGVTSRSECQFFDIEVTNVTTRPWIQNFDLTPSTFTLMSWVHIASDLPKMTLDFEVDELSVPDDTAYISLGEIKIYLSTREELLSKQIRHWYHMALVYQSGDADLYINGVHTGHIGHLSVTELWKETVSFTSSDQLNSVILSGLQMTSSALSESQVKQFALSCGKTVDKNILVVDKPDDTLVTLSSCDDTNDCNDDLCGIHGTCVDDLAHFTCLCDDPWTGPTCQDAPDYCANIQCPSGAVCVNQYEHRNYTCEFCPPPQPRPGHKAWECETTNQSEDHTCKIICDQGLTLLPQETNSFRCGKDTNYIWSHQTADNPEGILPDCADQKFPMTALLDITVDYVEIDCSKVSLPEVENDYRGVLMNVFTCTLIHNCNIIIKAEKTCGGLVQNNPSLGVLTMIITLESNILPMPQYFSIASDSELRDEMDKVSIVQEMYQQLMNNSDAFFTISIDGVDYRGNIQSVDWKSRSTCQIGSAFYNNTCVDCPAGSYSTERGGSCILCDRGEYQDRPAMTLCIPCANGTTTAGRGSYSADFCH